MKKTICLICACILATMLYAQTIPGGLPIVVDTRMNCPLTGPVSAIAVNPLSAQHLVLAGECGGLFETRNAGVSARTWQHVDDFMEHEIKDVAISSAAGGENIWVACSNSFYNVNGPLIWRREANGTWVQAIAGSGLPLSKAYRVVYNIYTQKVYACGDFGMAIFSKPGGSVTSTAAWTYELIPGSGGQPVYSFDVLQNGTIISMQGNGIFKRPAGSTAWTALSTVRFNASSIDRFAVKADQTRKIITIMVLDNADNRFKIYGTADNGNSIQLFQVPADVPINGAGGLRSVYPEYDYSRHELKVYESNCYEIRFAVKAGDRIEDALTAMQVDQSLSWSAQITGANIGHTDTRQIAFLTQGVFPAKMVVTSDGGFHIADMGTGLPGTWRWTTEGTYSGLKSLEITSVTGKNSEVFYATWHDGFGASLNQCETFFHGNGGEGIVLSKQGIQGNWDDRIFSTDGIRTPPKNSRLIFNLPRATEVPFWNGPSPAFTSGDLPGPVYYNGNTYIQQADKPAPTGFYSWQLTNDAGANWRTIVLSGYRRYGFISSLCRQAGTSDRYTFYAPVLDANTVKIVKITDPSNPAVSQHTIPTLGGLTGGIGALDLTNFRNGIFCANPFNDQQMIACESSTGKLKKSLDGGNSWTEVNGFNTLFGSGTLPLLKSSAGYNCLSVISWSPFQQELIIAGTLSQGVYLSRDAGTTWVRLNNPGVMMCVGVHWISANKLVIASYGRGLFIVNI